MYTSDVDFMCDGEDCGHMIEAGAEYNIGYKINDEGEEEEVYLCEVCYDLQ
ncbi:hypothetical protein PP175_29155 (plasmid) [Aneurinibacillus sp. Ricciae_BoGa-3]|uniref:hypothetical protein n=1 Tax=Aneurinibacillus sp. Ricciae_BoGa-3 TaxID=3022697 RepID=UPI00233FF9FF|nr:hypothetical protein [Aneurinibacillus sp. Ricciae_BoGa-3]WCK57261.1 hypothetical protein PP175_29155 [Aneurinibacillus sp. Ricciae_BoGa-3]